MERKERKIMVGVDESEESMFALSWCITNLIADTPNVKLVLLYVKPPPPMKKERVVGCGDAKDVICSAVQKLEADTLVLGTHGYGFFKR
ncbi:hypothetical protein JHK82_054330 [Glycine max]|nr:hypothetical protein JHK86_054175 [Glycine max]KAG4916678.1 hypothetical protein JHK87_054235 [Glycine soja]KAG4928648.1 hypothetical protein JHK85_055134 [Glycine max]KAG5084161.1 hypothetical protein JHK84_054199 [Glycine max]KAG5086933.1 hypothetical protein JHK82_054330 [Glycine max]